MRTTVLRVLAGFSCLPTATKFNTLAPELSSAFAPDQYTYILESTNPEDLKGGPMRVALTTFAPLSFGEERETTLHGVGDDVKTKHSSEKKNLPSRRIIGVRLPGGQCFGEVPPGSLPHWELLEGGITVDQVAERIKVNVAAREAAQALKARGSKKSA